MQRVKRIKNDDGMRALVGRTLWPAIMSTGRMSLFCMT
jgi:hypothetical protein